MSAERLERILVNLMRSIVILFVLYCVFMYLTN